MKVEKEKVMKEIIEVREVETGNVIITLTEREVEYIRKFTQTEGFIPRYNNEMWGSSTAFDLIKRIKEL